MEKKLYDDCFYANQKRYGLWHSTNLEGNGLITSLTEEECVRATRFYLKGLQEGWNERQTVVKSENSVVEGKL